MKGKETMQAHRLEKFAQFLDEHPGFSPELMGEDAYVYGFRVGECFLSVDEMVGLIATRVDVRFMTLLQIAPSEPGSGSLS
jgi:hypothetical protein